MKLWKKRPLSVDLSSPYEIPPTIFHISPGSNKIATNRCSMISTDSSVKDINFNHYQTPEYAPAPVKYPLKTFHDYRNSQMNPTSNSVSSTGSNNSKSCKIYLSPVTRGWCPVKEVVRIKRSASVPFRPAANGSATKNTSSTSNSQSVNSQVTDNKVKENNFKKNLSFSDKIKVFFRHRSASRASKSGIAEIPEEVEVKKELKRNSRSRRKQVQSVYVNEKEFQNELAKKLDQSVRERKSKMSDFVDKKSESRPNPTGNAYPKKSHSIPCKGNLSTTLAAHTESSAAKIRNAWSTNTIRQSNTLNATTKPTTTHSTTHTTATTTETGKKSNHPDKSHSSTSNSSKPPNVPHKKEPRSSLDDKLLLTDKPERSSRKVKFERPQSSRNAHRNTLMTRSFTKGESEILPNRISIPAHSSMREKLTKAVLKQKPIQKFDDCVSIAQIDKALTSSLMTQSVYVPRPPESIVCHDLYSIPTTSSSDNKRPNLISQQQTVFPSTSSQTRPTSCCVLVTSKLPTSTIITDPAFSHPHMLSPKSPYLSQYHRLYSLRCSQIDFIDKSTVSDHECGNFHLNDNNINKTFKNDSEKLIKSSIDSGLIEDMHIVTSHIT